MKILYTEYAEDTLLERDFRKEMIEDAILHPDEVVPGKKGRKIAHKKVGARLLRVVFEEEEKAYIVITAYYAEPGRYMT